MSDLREPMHEGEIIQTTALLSHVAGILEQLKLEKYEVELRDKGAYEWASAPEPIGPAARERALRWSKLREAARAAGVLIDAVHAALAHAEAARVAERDLPIVRAYNEAHAAAIRRAYPGTNVVPIHREASPDEPA